MRQPEKDTPKTNGKSSFRHIKGRAYYIARKAIQGNSEGIPLKNCTETNKISGEFAKSNDPETWCDYKTAVKASKQYSGIGFMFGNSPYFGVDVDNVSEDIEKFKNGEDGIVSEFINTLQSYTELSQSGTGIHIICRGNLPGSGRRKANVEMYESGRFFAMTGNSFSQYTDIADCTERIKPLHEKYIGGGREPVECEEMIKRYEREKITGKRRKR